MDHRLIEALMTGIAPVIRESLNDGIAKSIVIGDLRERLTAVEKQRPIPGEKGVDGIAGKDGAPGERGADGENGKDGTPGERGLDGVNGKDGKDGKDGAPGTPADLTFAPDDIAAQVAKAMTALAESPAITAKSNNSPMVLNFSQPQKTSKTITTRRDKNGNLVAEVVEN